MSLSLLILGGTSEGYALAAALDSAPGLRVISSLAGRTATPRRPAGACRIGGFGGIDGLGAYLATERIDAVIDATHPFASTMGWNAAAACDKAGVPLLRLERPAWVAGDYDRWAEVDNWQEAAGILDYAANRVLLALGRQDLDAFTPLRHLWFLIRSVDAPDPLPPFAHAEVLLARGPFSLDSERALLGARAIDTIVCKNSGGTATDAKLTAARELGLRVIMRRRPKRPPLPTAATPDEAVTWVERLRGEDR
ncbi:precorrin-6A reductase [Rhodospirillum rubrum F11]|uniref:Precorrin-6A reductase n=4 Tax=Rhodospirillum rubrum TaxID=1085 RepID=Q2RQ12_RHORT|nr:cobalt-precorrin-6A reductase [Rhodospirillum rubrum]AAN75033.1 CobK [Rhodospirillum rubrum ATCC 11170]ABC23783.1 precorrin-6A reductase [Rhodospirillum rubrum ATCC 11170]AEO49523.1 precorrin-6A reductase [Rhodospirillum rubrum F11]QXG79734.1 cobalt-precorrin-6A reductase [Rhodospirillum rubrum]